MLEATPRLRFYANSVTYLGMFYVGPHTDGCTNYLMANDTRFGEISRQSGLDGSSPLTIGSRAPSRS